MNSKRESKTSYTNANVRLLAILLSVVTWGLQARSVSAHENTLAAYTHSLGLQAEPAPEVSTKSPRCKLTLKLIDATTKEPLAGLVRIATADGSVQALEGLLNRGAGLSQSHARRQWSVLIDSAAVSVPREKLTIEAISGLETEMASRTIDLTGKSSAEMTLPLVRFGDAAKSGWRNGNTHIHLRSLTRDQADQYLRSISRADGLELVFVSYMRRAKAERSYISSTYTEQQLQQLSGESVFKREAAAELIVDMNEAMRAIREKASFADDKQADEILNVYREGVASLRGRLEKQ